MSLNKVQLTSNLIADLYHNVLLEATATAVPEVVSLPAYPSLGGNAKNILVVVAKPGDAYLPDAELTFLTSVLAACKLSLADIALVNYERIEEKDYQQLIGFFNSKTVLLFHIDPLTFGLPVNFPPFQVQSFSGSTYLHAPDLGHIEKEVGLKKSLWNALKNIFSI